MRIPGFSLQPPEWYVEAEKSGAIKELASMTTINGYVPYQRAKQVAIITGSVAIVLFATDYREKFSMAIVAALATATSFYLKLGFEQEKTHIMAIHNRIVTEKSVKT